MASVLEIGVFPSGSAMLFRQSSAPTHWTKNTSYNDYGLRTVTGTGGGANTSAGTSFSSCHVSRSITLASTTLTIAQMAAHYHYSEQDDGSSNRASNWNDVDNNLNYTQIKSSDTGSGGSHSHSVTMDYRINYVDIIIATKD